MERIDLDVFHMLDVILGSVGDSPTGSLEFPRIGDLMKRTDWFLRTPTNNHDIYIYIYINHSVHIIPVQQ
jgi:hypothetical protein